MVLKSDRWAALLGQAGGEDEARLVATPGMLEISYSLPASSSPGGAGLRRETKTEMVYQDATQRDEGPRLLVSLASVLKLKGLCEHEHARHDEVLEALKVCRLKYYKEIRWLRDQLQRATGNEGQVFWFDPQEGADLEPEGTEAAMLRELHDANGALREEVAVLSEENARLGEIVQEMASPEVAVRTLLREHGVHEVTVRLRKLLSRGPDGAELAEVIRELAGHDQEMVRLEEELQQLRQKSRDDEERLAELLVQADQLRAEAQSASRRAELEAARVAEAQLRVQQIELRNKALNEEMLAGQASAGPAPPQGVVAAPSEEGAEIAQMRDTISSMRHTMSSSTGQLAVTTRRLAQTFGKLGGHSPRTAPGEGAGDSGTAHDSLEEAISHLDSVAGSVEDRVQDVLRELRDLRSRVGRQDAALFGQLEQQRAELEELRSRSAQELQQQREEVARLEAERAASAGLAEELRAEALRLQRRLAEERGGPPGGGGAALGTEVAAAADEAVEGQPAAAAAPRSAAPRAAPSARALAQRPRLVLAEEEQAAEALAFIGSKADDLGRFLATAVQVRRFLRPAITRHREAEYIKLASSVSPHGQGHDLADRPERQERGGSPAAGAEGGRGAPRAAAGEGTPPCPVPPDRAASEQGAGVQKPHAGVQAGEQGVGAEKPHARFLASEQGARVEKPHAGFLAHEQSARVEKPHARLVESPTPPSALGVAVRVAGLGGAAKVSRSPSREPPPRQRLLEPVRDLSEVIKGQRLQSMPPNALSRDRTGRSMTSTKSEPVVGHTASLPPVRPGPNRLGRLPAAGGQTLGPGGFSALAIAQQPARARTRAARLPFQVDD